MNDTSLMADLKEQLRVSLKHKEVIAIYLPQFHEHPKNNEVWGAGFTDWTTTLNAEPLFPQHKQPIELSEFGKYDLKLNPSIIELQYNKATELGITGFAFYHYRFSKDERALDFPIKYLRQSNMPVQYMISWVNMNWTKSWVGDDSTLIHRQTYDFSDISEYARELVYYFEDPRYIRFSDKPLLYIHKPKDAPCEYLDTLLYEIEKISDKPFVIAPECHVDYKNIHLFDRVMSYPPGDLPKNANFKSFKNYVLLSLLKKYDAPDFIRKILFNSTNLIENKDFMKSYLSHLINKSQINHKYIPTFLSGWDNTPRYKLKGTVLNNYHFSDFTNTVLEFLNVCPQTDLLFFKSWNEWAEGNVLENV